MASYCKDDHECSRIATESRRKGFQRWHTCLAVELTCSYIEVLVRVSALSICACCVLSDMHQAGAPSLTCAQRRAPLYLHSRTRAQTARSSRSPREMRWSSRPRGRRAWLTRAEMCRDSARALRGSARRTRTPRGRASPATRTRGAPAPQATRERLEALARARPRRAHACACGAGTCVRVRGGHVRA
eukprot:6200560-Pleurochrysis_carterae.AAC.1